MNQYPSLDDLILQNPQGALLTPICAKEVFVLRTIGIRWQSLVAAVVRSHKELALLEGGFGPSDQVLIVTRKYMEGNVVKTAIHEISVPGEIFQWPL